MKQTIITNKDKILYYNTLVSKQNVLNLRQTANLLGIKERKFIFWLIDNGWLYRDYKGKLIPIAKKNKKYFVLKESFNEKTEWMGIQTFVTLKGRVFFLKELMKEGGIEWQS